MFANMSLNSIQLYRQVGQIISQLNSHKSLIKNTVTENMQSDFYQHSHLKINYFYPLASFQMMKMALYIQVEHSLDIIRNGSPAGLWIYSGQGVLSMKSTDECQGCETTSRLQIMNLRRHVGTSFSKEHLQLLSEFFNKFKI